MAICNRLMNLRNVEAMHAMEDEVLRLTRKLRDIEARDKAQQSTDSHLSFVLQRNQELERIIVSSFQETESLRQDLARLQRKLDVVNTKRLATDEINQLLAEDILAQALARHAAQGSWLARCESQLQKETEQSAHALLTTLETTLEIKQMRQYIKEAENSTSFERYVNLKTENYVLIQQLEQANTATPSRDHDPVADGSKRRLTKPKNVVMPLIGSSSNNAQRPGSWFRLNC
ncbi:hypothetical protein B5M09_010966 [Aphanomyces astaci]|uniref:Uncharacterized protein n=1 Tax=Aphanomyces astaci TaxID=112090 RepID=A0A3R7Z5A3_APHAT|nr:hypothetical protein B5M09_010966 [Aphanomyces astaci]